MNIKLDISKLNESLSDPKMISGIVGLGIVAPLLFPSLPALIPIASKVLISTGSVVIGGFTAYVTIDTVKCLFKEGK